MDIVDAILKNNTEMLLAYLFLGGDPNYSEDVAGVTLLHHAVSAQNVAGIIALLIFAAVPFRRDYILNRSPFDLAIGTKYFPAAVLMAGQISDQIPYDNLRPTMTEPLLDVYMEKQICNHFHL